MPAVDCIADADSTAYPSWREFQDSTVLGARFMTWMRDFYLPDEADRTKWECSPIFAPQEAFEKAPPTFVAVAELDILRDEGIAFAEKLKQAGVNVDLRTYQGCLHDIPELSGKQPAFGSETQKD